ncbi:hypothetical protein TNCV_2595251 [Trichonephila clavipes]|nr:hypothetical protein TNCV_2595251 [Trichonephila clavipes]
MWPLSWKKVSAYVRNKFHRVYSQCRNDRSIYRSSFSFLRRCYTDNFSQGRLLPLKNQRHLEPRQRMSVADSCSSPVKKYWGVKEVRAEGLKRWFGRRPRDFCDKRERPVKATWQRN